MGFFCQFLQSAKKFLGLYCEKFLNSEDFLRSAEDFRRADNHFFCGAEAVGILKNLKNTKRPCWTTFYL